MNRAGRPPLRGSSPLALAPAFALMLGFSAFLVMRGHCGFVFAAAAFLSVLASAGWYLLGTESADKNSIPAACALTAVLLSGILIIDSRIAEKPLPERIPETVGIVLSERKWGFKRIALVKAIGSGSAGYFPDKYVLFGSGEEQLKPGDLVRFSGALSPFERAEAAGDFDEFLYWRAKGGRARLLSPNVRAEGKSKSIAYFRFRLSSLISDTLPPRTAGYISASWIGVRDESLTEFHRNAGTSHLLAVSGLHVGVVYCMAGFLLRRFKWRSWAISAIVWAYALLSGASPSSLRAAAMLQFVMAGRLAGRSGNSFNCVCTAGSAMLLVNPWLFWDVGWRLSMLSVLTLTSIYSLTPDAWVKYLSACPAVWLVTSVQSAWTFGEVPLAGIVINFFAVPAFSVLLPASSLLCLPSLAGFGFGRYPAMFSEFLFAAWERFSNNMTFLVPWKQPFSIPMFSAGTAALVYLSAKACGFSGVRILAAEILCLSLLCFLYII
ncbi:MAG: ComEC family competence protein [Synergistaceae bacterium]|jgi:competence protein ComEC|nr:ComEC family competence protein [Synergistaceae bacterium]